MACVCHTHFWSLKVSASPLSNSALHLFSWMPSPKTDILNGAVVLWSRTLNDDSATFSSCDSILLRRSSLYEIHVNTMYDILNLYKYILVTLNSTWSRRLNYLVYKLYRRRIPFEYLGGDQATVNDCADETEILISSGGPGAG